MAQTTRFDEDILEDTGSHLQSGSPWSAPADRREQPSKKAIGLLIGLLASSLLLVYAIWSRTHYQQLHQGLEMVSNEPRTDPEISEGKSQSQCQKTNTRKVSFVNGQILQSQYYKRQYSGSQFSPPRLIWIYSQEEGSYLQQLNRDAIRGFAAETNHTVNVVSRGNYSSYLMRGVVEEVQNSIDRAQKREQAFYYPHQNEEYVKLVIVLALLQHHGGIYIEDTLTLLEPLQWLNNIHEEIYVNQVDRNMPTTFFAFHDVSKSSKLIQPTFRGSYIRQYVRVFPALTSHFMATQKRTPFISELNRKFTELLYVQGRQLIEILSQLQLQKWEYVYSLDSHTRGFLFSIASYLVLSQKQKAYDKLGPNNRFFAIDYYGVRTINKLYFPSKLQMVMDQRTSNNTYYHLARVAQQELLSMAGPLRYMVALEPLKQINHLLQRAKKGDTLRYIHRGSFLQKFLFPKGEEHWIVESGLVKGQKVQLNPLWQSLPRQVWIFWGSGLNESTLTHQLCTRRIRAVCEFSNFTYNQVSKANLHEYLSNETIDELHATLSKSKHKIYEQTYSDFVRLHLLQKYGGIYMDASFLLMEPLTWLLNITNYPSEFVYNRYGSHPKVFMFFNPQYATTIYQAEVDPTHNTRSCWHLAYENNFIAAEKGTPLITQWLKEFTLYHTLEHSQIKERFKGCGVGEQVWSNEKWSYLYQMDAIKCLIGRKSIQLKQGNHSQSKGSSVELKESIGASSAAEHYGIWSINGYHGVQKLRTFTNFQNPGSQNNLFAALYSERYVREVMGYPRELVKFFGFGSRELARLIFSRQQQIQPDSLVSRYLLKYRGADEFVRIVKEEPVLVRSADKQQ